MRWLLEIGRFLDDYFYFWLSAIFLLTLLFSRFIKNFKLKKQLIFLLWLSNFIWVNLWIFAKLKYGVKIGALYGRNLNLIDIALFILSVIPFLASGLDLYQWKKNKSYIRWACFPLFMCWCLLTLVTFSLLFF